MAVGIDDVVIQLGQIGLWLQALGIIVILWIIFQIIAVIVNRKKRKTLYAIKEDVERIEKKIDRLLKK